MKTLALASLSSMVSAHLVPISAPDYLNRPLSGYHKGSTPPMGVSETYNYCNMPHVNNVTYRNVSSEYELVYVELIHRHHKRTAYASNLLPGDTKESYMHYPQITTGGKIDSKNHGADLFGVYHDSLGFLPDEYDPELLQWRITNNNITQQVFDSLITGMYPKDNITAELRTVDNLEPNLDCHQANDLKSSIRSTDLWYQETNMTIYGDLAEQDGINKTGYPGFYGSIDHFFDNLSSKTCAGDAVNVTNEQFETVMKLGHWEYDYTFYSHPNATEYGKYKYGNFTLELAGHLQQVMNSERKVKYQHNVAHDGSISGMTALLSEYIDLGFFQWPGMGSEYVFELYKRTSGEYYLRILYSGSELKFVPVEDFFGYLEDQQVEEACSQCSK
jgi:acid phosphatase